MAGIMRLLNGWINKIREDNQKPVTRRECYLLVGLILGAALLALLAFLK